MIIIVRQVRYCGLSCRHMSGRRIRQDSPSVRRERCQVCPSDDRRPYTSRASHCTEPCTLVFNARRILFTVWRML